MTPRERFIVFILLIIGTAVFLPGINWGLPSHRVDPFLFGDHEIWNGAKILELTGPTEDVNRGADVSSHDAVDRTVPEIVSENNNDKYNVERARIVRRYRLMSYQPDEWNTLKALSEMKPGRGNLDPKLYQYGGLWVYPIGVMLKTASVFHLIDLRADQAWYLDHPEVFGRFYIVARLWSVIWGLIGIAAIYAIVRRIVGGSFFPTLAALGFTLMPVVVNMAHEAKPHLAGAVLMLLAVLAAARYAERGNRWAWMVAGALCGAALGTVLSALPIFLILPAMVLFRSTNWKEKLRITGGAVTIGLLVYAITNPYVPFNFVFHRAVLESNLGNSKAMYHANLTFAGITNAAYLIAAGTSPVLALAGVAGTIVLGVRAVRVRESRDDAEIRRRTTGLLVAIPALVIFGQCLFFATDKPGEFGRFMLFTDIFLLVEAVVALGTVFGTATPRGTPFSGPACGARVAEETCPSAVHDDAPQAGPLRARGKNWWSRHSCLLRIGEWRTFLSSANRFELVQWQTRMSAPPRFFPLALDRFASKLWSLLLLRCDARPTPIRYPRRVATAILILSTAIPGLNYLRAFLRDTRPQTSRLFVAGHLRELTSYGTTSLAVYADPAPYCLPPVNLFDGKIILLPKNAERDAGIQVAQLSIQAVDAPETDCRWLNLFTATPISWADKLFDIRQRK